MSVLIKVHSKGADEILNGRGDARLKAELQRKVDAIASRACALSGLPSGSFVGGVEQGRSRLRGYVVTATADAMVAEARDRVLTRALDAGR